MESAAYLPATVVVAGYDDDEELLLTAAYTFSSLDINEGISSAIFAITEPS